MRKLTKDQQRAIKRLWKGDYAGFDADEHPAPFNPLRLMCAYIHRMADLLGQDNPRFDRQRFLRACGVLDDACEHDRTRMDDGISSCLDCGDRIDTDIDN